MCAILTLPRDGTRQARDTELLFEIISREATDEQRQQRVIATIERAFEYGRYKDYAWQMQDNLPYSFEAMYGRRAKVRK